MLLGGLSVINSVNFLKRRIDNRSILKMIHTTTVNSAVRDVGGLQGDLCFEISQDFMVHTLILLHVRLPAKYDLPYSDFQVNSRLPNKRLWTSPPNRSLSKWDKKLIKYRKNVSYDLRYSMAITALRF
jgi:hypothetical protein